MAIAPPTTDRGATANATGTEATGTDATRLERLENTAVEPKEQEPDPPSAPDASFEEVVRLSLPGGSQAEGYAYDPSTGDLAIIGPWKNRLGIVSLDRQFESGPIKKVEQVELLGKPYKLAHKTCKSGALFAVSQTAPNGVLVVDVKSREVVKAIKLAEKPASFLPATGLATPHLYFTTSDRQGDGEIFRSPDGSFHMPSSSTIEIQRLNVDKMDMDQPLHISRLNSNGHAVVGETTVYYWRDFNTASLHSSGRYTIHQNRVYDPEFTHAFTVLECGAKTFLADGPWVAGVTREELVVCSINDGRIVTAIPIPSGYHRVADIFFDAGRRILVVGLGRHVVVVPIGKLDLPDEPILLFEERPPAVAGLRKPYEFLLTTVSGNPTFKLIDGPDDMKIEGNTLRWRPETAYTGPVDVKLEITAGDVTRAQSWEVTVE